MKITFIVPHFPPHIGGGEQLYLNVCSGLAQCGHRIRVVTSSSGGVTGHREMDGLDVYYYSWPLVFGHPVIRMKDIREHVKWCDVVHTAIYSTVLKSILVSRSLGKPCVVTFHEVMGDKWFWFERNPVRAALFRLYEGLLLRYARNVHAVSRATERDYLRYCKRPGNVAMIYNFVSLPPDEEVESAEISFRECFSLTQQERGILYFGRPAANKGIFVLIEAIRLVKDRLAGGDVRFCMVLSARPEEGRHEAMRLIRKYGLADIVRIHDSLPREELLKVVSGADLCVIPSVTEGFGFAVCEACHYGRPVLCADSGALPEVAYGKVRFFKNRDPADLADALLDYVHSGVAHFEDIPPKDFDRDTILREYMDMYESLLYPDAEG